MILRRLETDIPGMAQADHVGSATPQLRTTHNTAMAEFGVVRHSQAEAEDFGRSLRLSSLLPPLVLQKDNTARSDNGIIFLRYADEAAETEACAVALL